MRRSASISGASVVLDLLPKEITLTTQPAPVQLVARAGAGAGAGVDQGDTSAQLADCDLVQGDNRVPLGPIATHAAWGDTAADMGCDSSANLAAGRLPQALGQLLSAIAQAQQADAAQVYSASLCLAILAHNAEGFALLALLEGAAGDHPAVLALRGYLAFQCRHEDIGRRSLARAALLARANPAHRNILHFTQHVLLAHQFGA